VLPGSIAYSASYSQITRRGGKYRPYVLRRPSGVGVLAAVFFTRKRAPVAMNVVLVLGVLVVRPITYLIP